MDAKDLEILSNAQVGIERADDFIAGTVDDLRQGDWNATRHSAPMVYDCMKKLAEIRLELNRVTKTLKEVERRK